MSERDDDRPNNVIGFGNEIQIAIARLLRETYAQSLSEKLPDDILALFKQFDEVTKKNSGAKK
jgi:hypothetical protein